MPSITQDPQILPETIPSAADPDFPDYYEQRAEAELELAQAANHPSVVKAHYTLANLYLDLLDRAGAFVRNEEPLTSG